jgi:ferredoxin-thioredoxin reductase catalytic subunit
MAQTPVCVAISAAHLEALDAARALIGRKTKTKIMSTPVMLRYLIDDLQRKGARAVTVPEVWKDIVRPLARKPRKMKVGSPEHLRHASGKRPPRVRLICPCYAPQLTTLDELAATMRCTRSRAVQFLIQSLIYRWPELRAALPDWDETFTYRT